MSKRLEKISKIEDKLAQLENQRKEEVKKAKEEERKVTNKRHCKRGAVMEKALPDLISISDEQFDTFVKKALATNHSKNLLAELVKQNNTSQNSENTEKSNTNPQPKEQANSQTVCNGSRLEN